MNNVWEGRGNNKNFASGCLLDLAKKRLHCLAKRTVQWLRVLLGFRNSFTCVRVMETAEHSKLSFSFNLGHLCSVSAWMLQPTAPSPSETEVGEPLLFGYPINV